MKKLTAAVCTFNRAARLPELVRTLRLQECPVPWEMLFVDNNSSDQTPEILAKLSADPGVRLRFVREPQQGITFARNRAIAESLDSDYLFFMDDDELPCPGILAAAQDALEREGADCAGGQVEVAFPPPGRPAWVIDELLGFLAETNHGSEPFWITDRSTPIWTANVAYRMSIFRDNPDLRFDSRYNRKGVGVGGGSDMVMLNELLARKMRIRYRPDMVVQHYVEAWRLKRSYFLKLHFTTGRKYGQFELDDYSRSLFGVPIFLFGQAAKQLFKAAAMGLRRDRLALRQAMTASHALGMIRGCHLRWKESRQ